jgi:hypothetical protein
VLMRASSNLAVSQPVTQVSHVVAGCSLEFVVSQKSAIGSCRLNEGCRTSARNITRRLMKLRWTYISKDFPQYADEETPEKSNRHKKGPL